MPVPRKIKGVHGLKLWRQSNLFSGYRGRGRGERRIGIIRASKGTEQEAAEFGAPRPKVERLYRGARD